LRSQQAAIAHATLMKATAARKTAPATKASASAQPALRFRIRVNRGDVVSVGPGKIALLEAIAQTRSITAAAKATGMSYRRAWFLVDELNASLKRPAVASSTGGEHGGGSALTEVGTELVALYRRIEVTAAKACAGDIRRMLDMLN